MSFEAYLEQYSDGSFVALTNAGKCATQTGEQTGALVERIKKLESEFCERRSELRQTLCPESRLDYAFCSPCEVGGGPSHGMSHSRIASDRPNSEPQTPPGPKAKACLHPIRLRDRAESPAPPYAVSQTKIGTLATNRLPSVLYCNWAGSGVGCPALFRSVEFWRARQDLNSSLKTCQ